MPSPTELRMMTCRTSIVGNPVRAMRPDRVAELHQPLLVRTVVGAPVVVHDKGVNRRRFQGSIHPGLRVAENPFRGVAGQADKCPGDPIDLDHRRVQRRPGDAVVGVGNIDEPLDREPVPARGGSLVLIGPDHRPADVQADLRVGNGEAEAEMHPLLGADGLLVHPVDDVHALVAMCSSRGRGTPSCRGRYVAVSFASAALLLPYDGRRASLHLLTMCLPGGRNASTIRFYPKSQER